MSKIILITGASSGIGKETAIHLAKNNHIIVHYNSSIAEAQNVAKNIEEKGGTAYLVQANLANKEGCHSVAVFIKNNFNKLDVLVNNAGGLIKQHHLQDITWECMEKLFAINSFSSIFLAQLCVPYLQQGVKACIINITSTIIRSGGTVGLIYAAAKGAVDVFTRSLARELAPNIRVNGIAPGVIQTNFHKGVTPDAKMQEVLAMTPLKKFGKPKDIAKVVEMLIDNDFMTGETIDVNGGIYMR